MVVVLVTPVRVGKTEVSDKGADGKGVKDNEGGEEGIEDTDGVTVGSIVGAGVDDRPLPSSSLVPEEEAEVDSGTGSGSTYVEDVGIESERVGVRVGVGVGVRVCKVMVPPWPSISCRTDTVSTIVVGSESLRLWPLFGERAWWWVW